MEDDPNRARLVARVLAAESVSELTALLELLGPERVADAAVDAILHFSELHPSELTKVMCAAVQHGEPSISAIERGIAAIGDADLPEAARAAMLCALSGVPGMQSRLVLARVPLGEIARLVDVAKVWGRLPAGDTGSPSNFSGELVSELDVRREVRAKRASYGALVSHVFAAADGQEIIRRLGEFEPVEAFEALVDHLLQCPAEQRELVWNLIMNSFAAPSEVLLRAESRLARTRLGRTATDPSVDWDLRWHCFMVCTLLSDSSPDNLRHTPPFDALTHDDWSQLMRGLHRSVVVVFRGEPAVCSAAAADLDTEELLALLQGLSEDGVPIDWVGMFTYRALVRIWPFAAERLADAGVTQAVHRIEARLDVADADGQVRMRRAIMRLRNS